MRHRKAGIKLGRTSSHRNAMFRNMVTSLLKHGRIHTTDAKAKELRRWADHIITLAKRGDLHARRQALAIVNEKGVVHRLFEKAAEQFGGRAGGYTRLIKTGRRAGDAALMTMVELITDEVGAKSPEKASGKKTEGVKPRPPAVADARKEEESASAEPVPGEADMGEPSTEAAKSDVTGDVTIDAVEEEEIDEGADDSQNGAAAETPTDDGAPPKKD